MVIARICVVVLATIISAILASGVAVIVRAYLRDAKISPEERHTKRRLQK